jgi:hypothetical protein
VVCPLILPVLIAGKNGVGKTRLLQAIRRTSDWRYENRGLNLRQLDADITGLQGKLAVSKDYAEQARLNEELKAKLYQKAMAEALQTTAGADIRLPLVQFVPKKLSIAPLSEQTLGTINERSAAVNQLGVAALSEGTFSYIFTLQRKWFEATHSTNPYSRNREHVETVRNSYMRLESLLVDVLDTKLTRSERGEPLLFGHTLDEQKLSEGQKVLLQLVVALHAQGQRLQDLILFLDEPENHLHPSVLIDIIDKLRDRIKSGQLWICTHSVPLIAHIAAIDPYAIWYMANGEVKRAGRKPELILEGLLGNPATIGNLRGFMTLPHDLALANFAAQCLSLPQAVETEPDDPQLMAIAQSIRTVVRAGQPVRLLDYGAGKGRLLSGLQMQYVKLENGVRGSVDYYAYDEYETDKAVCEAVIIGVYSSAKGRYYNKFDELVANKRVFDLVVLTNVLHEIQPAKWPSLFSHRGIPSILSEDGWLLIVEDQRLPNGEKAHEFGFILLDTDQLKTLFGVEQSHEQQKLFMWTDFKGNGRIKAHLIHASLLSRFESERQRAAIAELRESALVEIRTLRDKKYPTYDDGQLHGLWTQLYANASLFLQPGAFDV